MRKLFPLPAAMKRDATALALSFPLLFLPLLGSAALADDLSTLEERFVCEGTQVQVSTTCATDPEAPFDMRCAEQHFIFADANGKILAKVPASGQLKENAGFNRKKVGQWLDALADNGACVRGRDGSFVEIGYLTTVRYSPVKGWEEIYDLKGHILASSRPPESASNEERDRIEKAYFKWWREMELQEPPGGSLGLRLFKDPLKLPKPASSEDWNHIRRYKPVGYEYRYMNSYNSATRDTLDIEKVNDRKIKFLIDTVDDSDRPCRLAREASSTNDDPRDFVFALGKKCRLHLKVSEDAMSIDVTDPGGYCASQHCTGFFGNITFRRVK